MDSSILDIAVSVVNALAVVSLKGALVRGQGDHVTEIVEWLCEEGERRIVLHTAGVTVVDVDGLVALVDCHAFVNNCGGHIAIKMPSGPLVQALRGTGLPALLEIEDPIDGCDRDAL